ncbi:MAG: thymidylate synthase [Candidatus Pacearchaeota archaeon]|nr:thymidylate synthase [Candidatus Pacearchaeota archaeon]
MADKQYLDHAKEILTSPYSSIKGNRKGSPIISLMGGTDRYDLRDGFPLLTTKRIPSKSIFHELIWFLRGDTNIKYLEDNGVTIWRPNAFENNLSAMVKEGIFSEGIKGIKYSPDWDNAVAEYGQRIREDSGFAERFGDAGPIYGAQWMRWQYFDVEKGEVVLVDQMGDMIERMKKRPTSKRNMVTAWQPGDVARTSQPPCHVLIQPWVNEEGELDLQMYQRSADWFLGIPFNIASYAALTQIIANETGLTPRSFVHGFGDAHIYAGLIKRGQWYREHLDELRLRMKSIREGDEGRYEELLMWVNSNAPKDDVEEQYDHVTALIEQRSRKPKENLPTLKIARKPHKQLTIDDFVLEGYESHPAIKRKMAV